VPTEGSGLQSASSTPFELGLRPPPRERADAARNRRRILDAAAQLFADHGVDGVSLDAVAAAAGVGKGTVFRRFGDKSGLAAALLDERERALQEAILCGPPPLGPGAPAPVRVVAFVRAYLEYALAAPELVRMSETASAGARFRIGAYRFWLAHLRMLLAEAGSPDPDVLAHSVLAPLAAENLLALRADGLDEPRIIDGLTLHAELVAGGAADRGPGAPLWVPCVHG
jgi:AcrR family transcriptional regulator